MKITMTKDEVIKTLLNSLPVNPDTQDLKVEIVEWNSAKFLTVTINEDKKNEQES